MENEKYRTRTFDMLEGLVLGAMKDKLRHQIERMWDNEILPRALAQAGNTVEVDVISSDPTCVVLRIRATRENS